MYKFSFIGEMPRHFGLKMPISSRDPTVSEKTPEEPSFADQVESLLSVIRDPAERQVVVECLVVIARIGERNPEIEIKDETLNVLSIVRDSITRFWYADSISHACIDPLIADVAHQLPGANGSRRKKQNTPRMREVMQR